MKNIKAIKINTDTWSMCFADELCLFLLGDGHSDYIHTEFEENALFKKHRFNTIDWITDNIEIQTDRLFYYSWYTDGLYTNGRDGIIHKISDLPSELGITDRKQLKEKTYGVEASVIFETRVNIPEEVIAEFENRVKFFFDNFLQLLPFHDGEKVKLTSIEYGENTLF
jgi:hypothetical protein